MVATGMILPFAGSATPDGWLVCDGSLVLKLSYKNLYDIIGDNFGPGSATEFALPAIPQMATTNFVPTTINYFIKF
jgi:microcystin-dependent protein